MNLRLGHAGRSEPSRVIAEQYRTVSITLKSGAILDGRILAEDAQTLSVVISPIDPDQRRLIKKSEVVTQRVSDISPMPTGLLNSLRKEEILDLIAFLERGGPALPPPTTGKVFR